MARLVFPNERTVQRPGAPTALVRNAAGATAIVYADAAATQLADIQTTSGLAIVGAKLIVDSSSSLPLFLGPDNVDKLYVVVDGGPVTDIYARSDDRLDVIEQALGIMLPREHGLIAWTTDPATPTAGKIAISGTVYMAMLRVPRVVTATQLLWGINTAGATATANANWIGLYNAAGTRLATINIDARIASTGLFIETLSVALTPGLYRVAWVVNATTGPAIYRNNDITAGMANAGITAAAQYRYATGGTAQTTLPASIDPAVLVASQFTYWAALG